MILVSFNLYEDEHETLMERRRALIRHDTYGVGELIKTEIKSAEMHSSDYSAPVDMACIDSNLDYNNAVILHALPHSYEKPECHSGQWRIQRVRVSVCCNHPIIFKEERSPAYPLCYI